MTFRPRRCSLGLIALFLQTATTLASPLPDGDWLSRAAGTPTRLFDPFAPGVEAEFRQFLATVPMVNQRPLPPRAARETGAALALLRRAAPPTEPTYFVAIDVGRLATATLTPAQRAALRARYGEDVHPQRVCPVFASRAGADVPALLSAATNLAADWFRTTPGDAAAYHRLFLLTEASHCGFLARMDAWGPLLQHLETPQDLRAFIEALGDYEAIIAFRRTQAVPRAVDEGEVLEAARTLGLFLAPRVTAYAQIPGLMDAFERYGVARSAARLREITLAVEAARGEFRRLQADVGSLPPGPDQLRVLARAVGDRLHHDGMADTPSAELARTLLARFPAAAAIIVNDTGAAAGAPARRLAAAPQTRGQALLTLPGHTAPERGRHLGAMR